MVDHIVFLTGEKAVVSFIEFHAQVLDLSSPKILWSRRSPLLLDRDDHLLHHFQESKDEHVVNIDQNEPVKLPQDVVLLLLLSGPSQRSS